MDALQGKIRTRGVRLMAPEDCTQVSGLRSLLAEVRQHLQRGRREVTVDLSRVHRMNAWLLATVLLILREVRRVGGRLRLDGVSDEFRKWAGTFRVLAPLERRGIIDRPQQDAMSSINSG